jgi:hypothetical protein
MPRSHLCAREKIAHGALDPRRFCALDERRAAKDAARAATVSARNIAGCPLDEIDEISTSAPSTGQQGEAVSFSAGLSTLLTGRDGRPLDTSAHSYGVSRSRKPGFGGSSDARFVLSNLNSTKRRNESIASMPVAKGSRLLTVKAESDPYVPHHTPSTPLAPFHLGLFALSQALYGSSVSTARFGGVSCPRRPSPKGR